MWWLIVLAVILVVILKLWPKGLWLVLAAAALLVAGAVYWNHKTDQELAAVTLDVAYDAADAGRCSAANPLFITITNNGGSALDRVQFNVRARIPGYSGEVTPYTYRLYDSAKILEPGDSYGACYRLPSLSRTASGDIAPGDLEWSAEAFKAYFR